MSRVAEIKYTPVFQRNFESEESIVINRGGTRCFSGNVLVSKKDGLTSISEIKVGDKVMSLNTKTNKIEEKIVSDVHYTPSVHTFGKVFVALGYGQYTTYDHKFLYRGKWYKIGMLAERAMAFRERLVIREQHGQIDYAKLEGEWQAFIDETITDTGLYENDHSSGRGKQVYTSSQTCSRSVLREPFKQATSESHKPQQVRQSGGEFRVGYSQREYRLDDEAWEADCQQWVEEWDGETNGRSSEGDKSQAQTFRSYKEGFGERVWRFGGGDKRRSLPILEAREITFKKLLSLRVHSWHPIDLYDLEVEDNHNYLVTENRIVAHNSSKSYSICQQLFIWLLTGQLTNETFIYRGVASVVRKFGATLERTILRDFKEIVDTFGYSQMIEYNITKREFKFTDKNGTRIIEFFGADDQQKIRGSKRTILYCNEANELNWDTEFFQLRMRTTDKIIIDFNPDSEFVWIKTELEDKRNLKKENGEPLIPGGCKVLVSTYKDNPFLEPFIVQQIEMMKYEDPVKWRVYGEGEYGIAEGMVFEKYDFCQKIPEGAKPLGYGLDFGYSNDPTVLVQGFIADNELYVKEIFRKVGMTNQDIALELGLHGVDKRDEIYADSSEPKSIEELSRMGWSISGVTKGRDSIRVGIDIMKRYKINIHFDSEELMKEFRGYRWETDRDGRPLSPERPKGGQDHGIDSLRYLCMAKLAKPQYRKYKIY